MTAHNIQIARSWAVIDRPYNRKLVLAAQGAIKIESGADERQMCERLWEVSKRFSAGTGLLRIESQMIRVGEHFLEDQARVLESRSISSSCASQRLNQPKRTDVEGAFVAGHAVLNELEVVSIDKATRNE